MIIVIQVAGFLGFVLLVITQAAIPLLADRPLFPLLRGRRARKAQRKLQAANARQRAARIDGDAADAEREADQLEEAATDTRLEEYRRLTDDK